MTDGSWVKVWDPAVRLFHWSLAALFFTAYLIEDRILGLHVLAGYGLLGLVVFRLIWGLVGTRHARFGAFVRRPGAVVRYLRDVLAFRAERHVGHNPAGGAMVVALLALVGTTALTGLAVYGATEFSGPLAGLADRLGPDAADMLEETHEVLANLTLLMVGLHLAGVALASLQHRENLVAAMFSGRKRYQQEEDA